MRLACGISEDLFSIGVIAAKPCEQRKRLVEFIILRVGLYPYRDEPTMNHSLSEDELKKVYAWVDEIPLSRPKKNIARDFSDGGRFPYNGIFRVFEIIIIAFVI